MEFDLVKYWLKAGLLVVGLGSAFFIADLLRKKNGLGWFEFFGNFGKYFKQVFMMVPKAARGFNLVSGILLVIGGLLVWLAIEWLSQGDGTPQGPLDMAPPSVDDSSAPLLPTTIDSIIHK